MSANANPPSATFQSMIRLDLGQEEPDSSDDPLISEDDIQLVLGAAPKKTTREDAQEAIALHGGDVVDAVMHLTVMYLNNKDTVTE